MNTRKFMQGAGLVASFAMLSPWVAQAQEAVAQVVCTDCYLEGLSADTKFATGRMLDNYETFLWSHKTGTTERLGRSVLDVLGVSGGHPVISGDGKVVASMILSDDGTYGTAGRWTRKKGWSTIQPLPADGAVMDATDSSVWSISGDGKTIGGLYWLTSGKAHGFYTDASGMVGLPTDGGSSRINAINQDGTVLVGWEESPTSGTWRTLIWSHGSKTVMGAADDLPGTAEAVNAAGTMVAGQSLDTNTFFNSAALWRWSEKKQAWKSEILGVCPGTTMGGMASAAALTDDGKIVTGMCRLYFSPVSSGFIWTQKAGMQTAKDYLAARGYSNSAYDIMHVPLVSADGKAFALWEKKKTSPYTIRGVIVRLKKTASE